MFLQIYGVTDALCLRLVRKYGNDAKSVLENDPYRIIRDVKGIGFKTADKIALNLGLSNNGPDRIDAGVLHIQQEAEDEGHTHMERREIALNATSLLETETQGVEERIQTLLDNEELIQTRPDCIQLPSAWKAEDTIAKSLLSVLKTKSSLPSIIIEKAIEWSQQKAGFKFAEAQSEGIRNALSSKVAILTGGPGTGKTTILRAIVSILKAKKGKNYANRTYWKSS